MNEMDKKRAASKGLCVKSMEDAKLLLTMRGWRVKGGMEGCEVEIYGVERSGRE